MPSTQNAQIFGISEGERRRALAYLIVALFGAGLSFIAVTRLSGSEVIEHRLGWHQIWMVLAGAGGATGALHMLRHRMGMPGLPGLVRAIVGALLISFVGALIAGTLALPVYGTMFGPFTLAVMFVSAPFLAALWGANLIAAHFLMQSWQAERDSIF